MFQTIRAKLRFTLVALTVLFVGAGAMTLVRQQTLNDLLHALQERVLPSIVASGAINTATSDYRMAEFINAGTIDPGEAAAARAEMQRLRTLIADLRKGYEVQIDEPEERAVYAVFDEQFDAYMQASERVAALAEAGARQQALHALVGAAPLFAGFSADLDRLVTLNQQSSVALTREADAVLTRSRTIAPIVLATLVGCCLLAVRMLDRRVSQPLAELSAAARNLADGRLEPPSAALTERRDEVGDVGRAVAAAADSVRRMTGELAELTAAAGAGMLSSRLDADAHKGDYGVLVGGVNALIEALSRPLHEVAEVMQRLAAGDLKGRMNGAYEGELRALKANLNRSLDSLVGLLGELSAVSGELAHGNLSVQIAGTYQGDFAQLRTNVNRAVAQLRDTLLEVQDHTQHVAAAATETAAAARQVLMGAATQTATLNEVATAIAAAATAAEAVSGRAEQSSQVARGAAELAQTGHQALERLVATVERVAGAQERIEQAITRIARIADKTHVLALNAGIEAVRAAEQGSGFGIVAHEIGRLAEDAAEATRAIESIIGDTAVLIRSGVGVAADTRATMDRLAAAAGESGAAVEAIAQVMVQQTGAVQQLAGQADTLRAGSRDNVAAAEQISVTMEELARMVHATKTQIDRFTLAS